MCSCDVTNDSIRGEIKVLFEWECTFIVIRHSRFKILEIILWLLKAVLDKLLAYGVVIRFVGIMSYSSFL